jgi:hypothetical protein
MNIHEIRYNKFIESRKIRILKQSIVEKHHIIPRSLGGKDSENNIIILTPREHYIAHLILWKAYGGKMAKAFHFMYHHGKFKLTSRQFENLTKDSVEATSFMLIGHKHSEETKKKLSEKKKEYFANSENREKFSNIIKQTYKEGRVNPNTGKKMSEKQKEKLSKLRKGKKSNSKGFTGHTHSKESKRKISDKISGEKNGMYGKHHSVESRQKMREAQLTKHRKEIIL